MSARHRRYSTNVICADFARAVSASSVSSGTRTFGSSAVHLPSRQALPDLENAKRSAIGPRHISAFLPAVIAPATGRPRATVSVRPINLHTEAPVAKAFMSDAAAYFEITSQALLALFETHPDPALLKERFSLPSHDLVEDNVQWSVAEDVKADIEGLRASLLHLLDERLS